MHELQHKLYEDLLVFPTLYKRIRVNFYDVFLQLSVIFLRNAVLTVFHCIHIF